MVTKKAYIRTLEAVIAIVIILIFIFTITPKKIPNPNETPEQVETAQKYILKEIANTQALRDEALNAQLSPATPYLPCNDVNVGTEIDNLVRANLPPGFDYSCAICSNTGCVYTPPDIVNSIYMDDMMITPENIENGPRIIRLWFWQI